MAMKRDRFFALFGAILFLVTASAFSILVIWQMATSGNNGNDAQQQQAAACQDVQTEPILPAPAVYKPAADVTKLEVTDLTTGSGQTAQKGDCLVVKYYGTLAKDGTVFDETYTKPTAFAFNVGAGSVIPGWDQGLIGMKVGGERRLVIPSELAYQSAGQGSIPPNADLVFVVKLLRIQP